MIPIPSRLYNSAVGGHVAGADQIIDDKTGLTLDKVTGGTLEEKEYTSGSNDGMGRVVLRKNLVEGVNTLVQTMINNSNTIYVIQYDFTLGEDITVPANCVLEFDGGSIKGDGANKDTLTGQHTVIDASVTKIFDVSLNLSGNFVLYNGLNLAWFGSKPENDITSILTHVIKQSVRITGPNLDYKQGEIITLPTGEYTLSGNVLGELTERSMIHIRSLGSEITTINCTSSIVFDNAGKFGFSDFEGIKFVGNNTNLFMKLTLNNPQSLSFINCEFQNFASILEANSTMMDSEITFIRCKIRYCHGNLFVINNMQAVNWRFYATEIESVFGNVFNIQSGGNIYYYQGSIIVSGTSESPSYIITETSHDIGLANTPTLTMYGVRFELRGYTKLLNKLTDFTPTIYSFVDDTFVQQENTVNGPLVEIKGSFGKLYFTRCANYPSISHSNGNEGRVFEIFTDQSLTITSTDSRIRIHDSYLNSVYSVDAKGNIRNSFNCTNQLRITRVSTQRDLDSLFYIFKNQTTNSITIPGSCVASVICKNKEHTGYGSQPFSLNLYAVDANNAEYLLCTFRCNINAASQEQKYNFPTIFCNNLKIEVVMDNPNPFDAPIMPRIDLFIVSL